MRRTVSCKVVWTEPYHHHKCIWCEQKVQSGIDKSGRMPDTKSRRQTVAQLCVDHASPQVDLFDALRNTRPLTCTWNARLLSLARLSKWDGEMSYCASVTLGHSLYRLYCPPGVQDDVNRDRVVHAANKCEVGPYNSHKLRPVNWTLTTLLLMMDILSMVIWYE